MADNSNLHMSRAGRTDEFYTQLSTIEEELRHYRKYFKDKIVLCNCDDPYESNFFKYFALNFNSLGLKKLITTCYATSPIMYTQLSFFGDEKIVYREKNGKEPYKIEITEVKNTDGNYNVDLSDVEYLLKNNNNSLTLLIGDGDFRSEECLALLNECDIVVTNPPFSLMKEYIPL
ncbi:MAG: adenine-specific methyltransferase EcoRI family protein, partial [Anaerovoracaceae bacterium]